MMSSGVVGNEDRNNDGVMEKSTSSSKRSRNEAEHATRKDMRLPLDNAPTLAKEGKDDNIKSATLSMLLQADRERGKRVAGSNKEKRVRRMSRDQKANLGTVIVEIPLSPSASPSEGLSRGGTGPRRRLSKKLSRGQMVDMPATVYFDVKSIQELRRSSGDSISTADRMKSSRVHDLQSEVAPMKPDEKGKMKRRDSWGTAVYAVLNGSHPGVYETRQQALDANPGEIVIVRGYNSFSAAKRAAKSRQGGYHNFQDDADTDKSEDESEDEALDW